MLFRARESLFDQKCVCELKMFIVVEMNAFHFLTVNYGFFNHFELSYTIALKESTVSTF